MPEMLSPGAALVGAGLGKTVALVTDGRFSGASHGEQSSLDNLKEINIKNCTKFYLDRNNDRSRDTRGL